MSQSPSSDDASSALRPDPTPAPGELEVLQELLLGREEHQWEGLQQRIENPSMRAQDVSGVLPQAVSLATARGPSLAAALTPAVGSALKESVRRDPTPLANAVFPIIGPAIRKAIAEAFSRLVQSLNRTLDHSLSARGPKWRLEAVRTGRSFAEVVLAHEWLQRAEQALAERTYTGYGEHPGESELDVHETLTKRERLVLQLAAEGSSNPRIAKKLFISPRTRRDASGESHAQAGSSLSNRPGPLRHPQGDYHGLTP